MVKHMKRNKDYGPNSRRLELIKAICMCGIIPYNALDYMPYETEMIRRVVRKMMSEGTVIKEKVNGKTIIMFSPNLRLDDNRNILDNLPDGYYDYYQEYSKEDRNRVMRTRKDDTDRERVVANADALLFFNYCGIGAYIGQKTRMGDTKGEPGDFYYSSRDIRHVYDIGDGRKENEDGRVFLSSSRINGIYVTENNGVYAVYDIGNRDIRWFRNGEIGFLQKLRRISAQMKWKQRNSDEAIFLYSSDSILDRVLEGRSNKKGNKNLSVDMSYDSMYFLPLDIKGQLFIKIMGIKDWKEKALSLYVTDKQRNDAKRATIKVDGYDAEKRMYICVFCIPDMVVLKQFITAAKVSEDRSKYLIYCLDYQKEFIETLCRDYAQIETVDFTEFVLALQQMQ